MKISSNIDFVRYFAKEYHFFTIGSDLYFVYDVTVISFDSEKAKHIVNVVYQDKMNKLAPSNNFLMQNIKSRVLADDVATFDKAYQRFMKVNDSIICDLVNGDTLVVITPEGYQLVNRIASKHLNLIPGSNALSLPRPSSTELSLLDMIEGITNFSCRDDLVLFTTWLVSLCIPDLNSPILILLGEQGSGKSFTSELVKRVIDPSRIGKQHKIKTVQDFALLVSKSYVSIIDNLSSITEDISDAMCQTVSNGQFTTRKLYTNNETSTLDMKAKLVINGITIMNTKPDLLERSIVLTLQKLGGSSIKDEASLVETINLLLPQILDQIYLAVAHVLDKVNSVKLKSSPRLADFAKYLVSIGEYLNVSKAEMMRIYYTNIELVNEIIIDDPVIQALLRVLTQSNNNYIGTTSELLDAMNLQRVSGLPKAANSLSAKLTRLSSDLAKVGITIKRYKNSDGMRLIEIARNTAIRR